MANFCWSTSVGGWTADCETATQRFEISHCVADTIEECSDSGNWSPYYHEFFIPSSCSIGNLCGYVELGPGYVPGEDPGGGFPELSSADVALIAGKVLFIFAVVFSIRMVYRVILNR